MERNTHVQRFVALNTWPRAAAHVAAAPGQPSLDLRPAAPSASRGLHGGRQKAAPPGHPPAYQLKPSPSVLLTM